MCLWLFPAIVNGIRILSCLSMAFLTFKHVALQLGAIGLSIQPHNCMLVPIKNT